MSLSQVVQQLFQGFFGTPTVSVTGAAGFIGSHLVERLLQLGCHVIGIDDFDPWYSPHQKRSNLFATANNSKFELVDGTLSPEIAREAFSRSSVVFHLAGRPVFRTPGVKVLLIVHVETLN